MEPSPHDGQKAKDDNCSSPCRDKCPQFIDLIGDTRSGNLPDRNESVPFPRGDFEQKGRGAEEGGNSQWDTSEEGRGKGSTRERPPTLTLGVGGKGKTMW